MGSEHLTERVTLARLLRPHGLRGEIAAQIFTDFPERLTKLKKIWLWDGRPDVRENEPREMKIKSCWLSPSHGGQAVFHFEGIDSIEAVEKLRGLEVQIPLADRVKIPKDNYFVTDLIGCEVWEEGAAEPLGKVRDVMSSGTSVLAIDTASGELLVPLATEICTRVDIDARRIEVKLPEGLRELNRG